MTSRLVGGDLAFPLKKIEKDIVKVGVPPFIDPYLSV